MQMSHRGSGPVAPAYSASLEPAFRDRSLRHRRIKRLPLYLVGTLVAASVCASVAQAASFGHSRIVSAWGQPLHLEIPVTGLTAQEIESLRVTPAPGQAWYEAGMTPPVPVDSMRLLLLDGYRPDVKVIQLRSHRAVDQPIVDVLLDVRSVSGQQRYQVSLLAHADTHSIQRASVEANRNPRVIDGRPVQGQATSPSVAGRQITVRRGDNMFAIARRNAVQGVTVYQMMIALQRSNAHAFIEGNVNLVKAGATLTMPDMDVLTALSDREARRIFQQHADAFARYGQRGIAADVPVASTVLDAAEGAVSEPQVTSPSHSAPASNAGGDRLRLSVAPNSAAAAGTAQSNSAAATGGAGQANHADAASNGNGGPTNGALANGTQISTAPSGGTAPYGSGANRAAAPNGNSELAGGATGVGGTSGPSRAAGAAGMPQMNLLASSGAIASDAITHDGPDASDAGANASRPPFGSDAATGGTVLTAGELDVDSGRAVAASNGTTIHPDDEAALQKGVAESKKRILELEDNVRHLNEALQNQGHVAAEAALEGARSVTEVIKEVMSLVDADEESEGPSTATQGDDAASTPGSANASADSGSGDPTTPWKLSSGVGSSSASNATEAAVTPDSSNGSAHPASSAASTALKGSEGSADASSSGRSASTAASSAPQTNESVKAGTAGAEASKSSWVKENMLAVLGGGLALIILIAVWLLRRASSVREERFDSENPITDSMLQDKLREIDLDLGNPPSSGRRSS